MEEQIRNICTFAHVAARKIPCVANSLRQLHPSQATKTFHNLTCRSKLLLYLMECVLYELQHLGKSETPFNLHLNN